MKTTYTGRIRLKRVPDKRTGHPHISGNHNSSLKVNFDLKMPFAVIWEPVVNYAIYRGKLWQPYVHWIRCLLLSSMSLMARIKLKFNIKTTVLTHFGNPEFCSIFAYLVSDKVPKRASALPYSAKVLCLDSVILGRRKKEGGRETERDRERGTNSFPDMTRHRTIN